MHPLILTTLATLASPEGGLHAAALVNPVATHAWGTRGLRTLDMAVPLERQIVTVSLAADVASATSLFSSGDTDFSHAERLYVVWSTPVEGLEVGISQGLATNTYNHVVEHQVQVLGNPALRLKWGGRPFVAVPTLWLGGVLQDTVLSSPGSGGLVLAASRVQAYGTLTWVAAPHMSITANFGYELDRSSQLMASPSDDERFALGIDQAEHHMRYGLGAVADTTVGPVKLAPFVDVAGTWADNRSFEHNPLRASVGLTGSWHMHGLWDVGLGADARLLGAPESGAPWPGLPPWTVYARLSMHFAYGADATQPALIACDEQTPCPAGYACQNNECVPVLTDTIQDVPPPVPTFVIAGTVFDGNGTHPPEQATVVFSSNKGAVIVVDPYTGAFSSPPLPSGDGAVRVQATAPGYVSQEKLVPMGADGETVTVELVLRRETHTPRGWVRGTLLHSRTGRTIRGGMVLITNLKQTFDCDDNGAFELSMPPGKHTIHIVAPGFVPQQKRIVVHEDEVVILNVDLRPRLRTRLR